MSSRPPNDDPRHLLLELGVTPPEDGPIDNDALAPLDLLRAQIGQDLEKTQGPWRRMGPMARYWPSAIAAVLGLAFVLAMKPATLTPLLLAACCAAGAAAVLSFVSVVLAPSRPGLAERLSWGGLGIALVALCLEAGGAVQLGDRGFTLTSALRCSSFFLAGSVLPLVLLVVGLRRSGLPVRRLHAIALVAAGLAVGGLGIWRHCAPPDLVHMLATHVLLPLLLVPLLVFSVSRMTKRG